MMSFADRLPLLLLTFGVAVACDITLTAGDGFGLDAPRKPSAEERKGLAQLRVLNGVLAIVWLIAIGSRRRPDIAFGATLLWAIAGPAMVQAGAAIRARRYRDEAIPGPRYLDPHQPPTVVTLLGWPLQLLHASTLAVVCLFFRWTLPHMPSVAPLHWTSEGNAYVSPTRLWWSLSLIAFNLAMILFSAWAAAGPTFADDDEDAPDDPEERARASALDVQRRAISLRLVETLLIGLNLVAMAMWVAAILSLLPGAHSDLAPTGAIGAATLAALVLVTSLTLYLPPILRTRAAQKEGGQAPPSEPQEK